MKTFSPRLITALTGSALALVGCTSMDGMDDTVGRVGNVGSQQTARATLMTPNGTQVGQVTAVPAGDGLHVRLTATGLPPGLHGAHIHQTGQCTPPDFTSAGGHWNPTNASHGTMDDRPGAHAGDLPNLVVGPDGTGTLVANTPAGTFDGLFDADGSAFVVHAGADDLRTDPSGNSGSRIACGVFQRS